MGYNIVHMERSIAQLQRDNLEIKRDIADIRRDQDVQAKQIEMLTHFVQVALDERIDLKAENAAYRIITGMQRSRQSDENSDK